MKFCARGHAGIVIILRLICGEGAFAGVFRPLQWFSKINLKIAAETINKEYYTPLIDLPVSDGNRLARLDVKYIKLVIFSVMCHVNGVANSEGVKISEHPLQHSLGIANLVELIAVRLKFQELTAWQLDASDLQGLALFHHQILHHPRRQCDVSFGRCEFQHTHERSLAAAG